MKTNRRKATFQRRLWRRIPALALCALMLVGCAQGGKDVRDILKQEDLPNGLTDRSDSNAPKALTSKELVSFEYEGGVLDYQVCHFNLALEDDGVWCTGWGHRGYGDVFDMEFMAALSSLDNLQAVVDEHGLAKHNGISITVNDLPPYQGESLFVKYASGEEISAYNNQSRFLSEDARLALFTFFSDLANEANSGFYTEEVAEASEEPSEGIEDEKPPITWDVKEDSMEGSQTFVFSRLPQNADEIKALSEEGLTTPYQTAALTVAALCRYGENPQAAIDMLNYLKGPQALSPYEIQFLKDRLEGKEYKPFSFFDGATPENNYTPTEPYTIIVFSSSHSFQEEGYAQLLIRSSGADNPREIKLREQASTGEWFLWENFLLSDIRVPKAADPWG